MSEILLSIAGTDACSANSGIANTDRLVKLLASIRAPNFSIKVAQVAQDLRTTANVAGPAIGLRQYASEHGLRETRRIAVQIGRSVRFLEILSQRRFFNTKTENN